MSMADEDIKLMKEWGINFVRMGVMWEAVETIPGIYNTTYLDDMNKLITKLG
jgi:aryl-phospho-beta-D-glucosidase BglC (GH1 family)